MMRGANGGGSLEFTSPGVRAAYQTLPRMQGEYLDFYSDGLVFKTLAFLQNKEREWNEAEAASWKSGNPFFDRWGRKQNETQKDDSNTGLALEMWQKARDSGSILVAQTPVPRDQEAWLDISSTMQRSLHST